MLRSEENGKENRTPARTGQNPDQRLVGRRLDVGVVEDDERALATCAHVNMTVLVQSTPRREPTSG